jgi:Family of unknown function (DUF6049)
VRVALACAVVMLVLPPAAAHAAPATPSPPSAAGAPVGMHLVYQDPWVAARGSFTMLLKVDNAELAARPGAAIAIRIHERADTRTGFDQVIANQDLGGILDQPNRMPIASLPRLGGALVVTLGLPRSGVSPGISVSRPGAYPVEVSITNTGTEATGSFVTWLVIANPNDIAKKLDVAWVWQVVAPPLEMPDGTNDPTVVAQMKPKGRLDRVASVLANAGDFPVSLVVGPETVESWSALAEKDATLAPGLARVRAAARRSTTEVLPASYVPIDDTIWEAAGFGPRYREELVKGARSLQGSIGVRPTDFPTSTFADPANDASIDRLRQMPVTRVGVRDTALVPVTHPFTASQGFTIVTQGGRSQGAATSPFIEQMLAGSDPPALKAQRVIAALTEIAFEQPGIARGVVLAPDARWNPDVAAMKATVDALKTFPLVHVATLDEFFNDVSTEHTPTGADVERTLVPITPAAAPLTPDEWDTTARELEAYAAVVGQNDPLVDQSRHLLDLALSTAITSDRAHETLARIEASIRGFSRGITVDAKRITLTARQASVPLSFENKLSPPRTIRVQVHLASPKLVFPKGDVQTIDLEPGVTTHSFDVEARTSGTFPLDITLTSADGQLTFGDPVKVTVRSAVFGGFAVALTIAALVFLALWWGNHYRRTRRAKRLATPAVT